MSQAARTRCECHCAFRRRLPGYRKKLGDTFQRRVGKVLDAKASKITATVVSEDIGVCVRVDEIYK